MSSRTKDTALFPIRKDGKWGFVDSQGRMVVKPRFGWVGPIRDGLARFTNGGDGLDDTSIEGATWGFVDAKGKVVLEPRYDEAGDFSERLAPVLTGADRRDVHYDGEILIGGKWGYVDASGFVIEPGFDRANRFSEGLAAVRRPRSGFGFMGRNGKFVIKPRYEDAGWFSEGMAPVRVDDEWGYIDTSAQFIIKPRFEWAGSFSAGLAVVRSVVRKRYRWRFINRSGKVALDLGSRVTWVLGVSEGLAAVNAGGRWGYIDTRGTMKIKPRWNRAWSFSEGLAMVTDGRDTNYIDKRGEVVI